MDGSGVVRIGGGPLLHAEIVGADDDGSFLLDQPARAVQLMSRFVIGVLLRIRPYRHSSSANQHRISLLKRNTFPLNSGFEVVAADTLGRLEQLNLLVRR